MLSQPPLWLILVAFICMLGPLVFFHELGHYLIARLFGIPAETFSIGFGRELIGWTDKQGTRWKVAWLPLGGYVKFVGDMSPASDPTDLESVPEHLRDRVFQGRPVWQRFLVVLAGPAANFLLAIIIFSIFFSVFGVPMAAAKIGTIKPHSAAASAGLLPGDRILSIDGKETRVFNDIQAAVAPRPNETMTIAFARDGTIRHVRVKLGADSLKIASGENIKIGLLGVSPAAAPLFEAVPMAIKHTGQITIAMVEGVARLIRGQGSRKELGGPIKIAQIAGQTASLGPLPFMELLAIFSINLGFINLLPVPLTD